VDSGTTYRGRQPVLLLDQEDSKEIPPELEVGLDPQVSLTQRDESHDVLDPVRAEVLQLDPVVVKEPSEEGMRGRRNPALVEVREGDDITVARCRHLLTASKEPLSCSRLRAEKPALDKNPTPTPDVPNPRPSGTTMPLLGGGKGSRALTGARAQMGNGSDSGGGEVEKAERQDWRGDARCHCWEAVRAQELSQG
jgi:hypothetical protein